MSTKLFIRLNDTEVTMLKEMVENNDTTGFDSHADFLRLLLWRENNRRKGLGPPRLEQWAGIHRQQDYSKRRNNRCGSLNCGSAAESASLIHSGEPPRT